MGNEAGCKAIRIDTTKIKMYDDAIKTVGDVNIFSTQRKI